MVLNHKTIIFLGENIILNLMVKGCNKLNPEILKSNKLNLQPILKPDHNEHV